MNEGTLALRVGRTRAGGLPAVTGQSQLMCQRSATVKPSNASHHAMHDESACEDSDRRTTEHENERFQFIPRSKSTEQHSEASQAPAAHSSQQEPATATNQPNISSSSRPWPANSSHGRPPAKASGQHRPAMASGQPRPAMASGQPQPAAAGHRGSTCSPYYTRGASPPPKTCANFSLVQHTVLGGLHKRHVICEITGRLHRLVCKKS